MFKLLVLAGSVLAFAAAPAMAGGHMKMEPLPGIFIPIPPDVELPPPEDGPEKLVEFAMMFLDKDGDGVISKSELRTVVQLLCDASDGSCDNCTHRN